ncbi:PA14 domain-containing protein [Marinobacter sp. C2H3]|uniref:PA14 domain-containing protein n=1 Tax=Marinobacter sp. C2H3 TaxID=3119003 RepID=UPI00300F46AF
MKILVSSILGSCALLSGCQSLLVDDIGKLPPTAALPESSVPGQVEARYYLNVPGKRVQDLETSPKYPDNPDQTVTLTQLAQSVSQGDNYGTLVRGYITPPETGQYQFFLSSDDESEFSLSTSSASSDARLIATVPGSAPYGDFSRYSSQKSGLITLEKGKRYYFELSHKEATGGDSFMVAWSGPGLTTQPIGSSALISYGQPLYPEDGASRTAYNLGYRIGYFDAQQSLAFEPGYPPLDSDQDGIYDNWETLNGLDPTNANDATTDPDGDLLTAADEFLLFTQENNPDTDGDGIADGTEFAYQLDPRNPADASQDNDGDGYTNLEEIQAGTSPLDATSVPTPTSTWAPGAYGQYFTGQNFDKFVFGRTDANINFSWGYGAPDASMPADGFSVRWVARFTPPASSGTRTYRFEGTSDDGIRAFLNGKELLNGFYSHGVATFTGQASLAAGSENELTIEYFEATRGASAKFAIIDTTTGQPLPLGDVLSHPATDTVTKADADSDGVPDWWEVRYGLSPFVADSGTTLAASGVTPLSAYETQLNPWTLQPITDIVYSPPTAPTTGSGGGSTSVLPATNTITLSWTPPLTRADGTALSLSEIAKYEVVYGQAASILNQAITVSAPETSYTFDGLQSGTWYFAVKAIDVNGLQSDNSEVVSFTVGQ